MIEDRETLKALSLSQIKNDIVPYDCYIKSRDGSSLVRNFLSKSDEDFAADEITEVALFGCYVRCADGSVVLRDFQPYMSARPKVGDFWVVFDDSHQSITSKEAFGSGFLLWEKYNEPA